MSVRATPLTPHDPSLGLPRVGAESDRGRPIFSGPANWWRKGLAHSSRSKLAARASCCRTPLQALARASQAERPPGGTTSLVGEEPSHLWPTFPRDPLGFSQIPGHCVLLSVVCGGHRRHGGFNSKQNLGLTHQPAPTHLQHPYEKRPKLSKKMLAERCSTQSSTGCEWMPQGTGNGDPWRR